MSARFGVFVIAEKPEAMCHDIAGCQRVTLSRRNLLPGVTGMLAVVVPLPSGENGVVVRDMWGNGGFKANPQMGCHPPGLSDGLWVYAGGRQFLCR